MGVHRISRAETSRALFDWWQHYQKKSLEIPSHLHSISAGWQLQVTQNLVIRLQTQPSIKCWSLTNCLNFVLVSFSFARVNPNVKAWNLAPDWSIQLVWRLAAHLVRERSPTYCSHRLAIFLPLKFDLMTATTTPEVFKSQAALFSRCCRLCLSYYFPSCFFLYLVTNFSWTFAESFQTWAMESIWWKLAVLECPSKFRRLPDLSCFDQLLPAYFTQFCRLWGLTAL